MPGVLLRVLRKQGGVARQTPIPLFALLLLLVTLPAAAAGGGGSTAGGAGTSGGQLQWRAASVAADGSAPLPPGTAARADARLGHPLEREKISAACGGGAQAPLPLPRILGLLRRAPQLQPAHRAPPKARNTTQDAFPLPYLLPPPQIPGPGKSPLCGLHAGVDWHDAQPPPLPPPPAHQHHHCPSRCYHPHPLGLPTPQSPHRPAALAPACPAAAAGGARRCLQRCACDPQQLEEIQGATLPALSL